MWYCYLLLLVTEYGARSTAAAFGLQVAGCSFPASLNKILGPSFPIGTVRLLNKTEAGPIHLIIPSFLLHLIIIIIIVTHWKRVSFNWKDKFADRLSTLTPSLDHCPVFHPSGVVVGLLLHGDIYIATSGQQPAALSHILAQRALSFGGILQHWRMGHQLVP